jgi:hypothetical protein
MFKHSMWENQSVKKVILSFCNEYSLTHKAITLCESLPVMLRLMMVQ